jgi:hypothetical protein
LLNLRAEVAALHRDLAKVKEEAKQTHIALQALMQVQGTQSNKQSLGSQQLGDLQECVVKDTTSQLHIAEDEEIMGLDLTKEVASHKVEAPKVQVKVPAEIDAYAVTAEMSFAAVKADVPKFGFKAGAKINAGSDEDQMGLISMFAEDHSVKVEPPKLVMKGGVDRDLGSDEHQMGLISMFTEDASIKVDTPKFSFMTSAKISSDEDQMGFINMFAEDPSVKVDAPNLVKKEGVESKAGYIVQRGGSNSSDDDHYICFYL